MIDAKSGDYYTSEALCKIINKDALNEFDLMSLQSRIQSETGLTVKIEGGGLRILTASEASEYNNHRFGLHLKKMYFRHGMMQKVNRTELSESENAEHDRRIEVQSKVLQAVTPVISHNIPKNITPENAIPKIF
jgi:hypothetical protein